MSGEPPVTLDVSSSGSGEPALDEIAEAFERAHGHHAVVAYSADLDDMDIVVASRDAFERKYKSTGLVDGSGVSLGRLGFGVAIRSGAPVPAIGSVAELLGAMRDAEVLHITAHHTSGMYIEETLQRLGVSDELGPKLVRHRNGPALMDAVLAGRGTEFAFLSSNAIRTYRDRGLILVGMLPEEIQRSREFVVASTSRSAHRDAAELFVRFCAGREARAILTSNGFE